MAGSVVGSGGAAGGEAVHWAYWPMSRFRSTCRSPRNRRRNCWKWGERARTPSPETQELYSKMREATDEEREVIRAELDKLREVQRAKTEVELKQIVSEQQFARIQQLSLQSRGISAMREDDVANDLKLSAQQRDQIKVLMESMDEKRSCHLRRPAQRAAGRPHGSLHRNARTRRTDAEGA